MPMKWLKKWKGVICRMILNSEFIADEKSALLFIVEPEEQKVHISWEINGEIIAFERIPVNYPTSTLIVWKNRKEYLKAISLVDWINEENLVMKDDGFEIRSENGNT